MVSFYIKSVILIFLLGAFVSCQDDDPKPEELLEGMVVYMGPPDNCNDFVIVVKQDDFTQFLKPDNLAGNLKVDSLEIRFSYDSTDRTHNCGFGGVIPVISLTSIEVIGDQSCGDQVTLDTDKFINGDSDHFNILKANINGNCLEITYSSSGCDGSTWEEEMVDSEQVLESFPPQKKLRLLLNNKELCQAVFTKTVNFDLSKVQLDGYDRIILNIDGLDERLIYNYTAQTKIIGEWDLINVNGGLVGIDQDFQLGDIIWIFHETRLTVDNNNPQMNPLYDGLSTGAYDYVLNESNGVSVLSVDGEELGWVDFRSDRLLVDQRAVDGFQLIFRKSNSKLRRLDGKWNLVDVTCECAPVDFEIGEHVWVFDLKQNQVDVTNTVQEPLQILENGTYSIDVEETKITIQNVRYDYYFENDKLYLADQPEADGPLMEFVKD